MLAPFIPKSAPNDDFPQTEGMVIDDHHLTATTLILMAGEIGAFLSLGYAITHVGIDLAIVDSVIDLIHREQFFHKIFVPTD